MVRPRTSKKSSVIIFFAMEIVIDYLKRESVKSRSLFFPIIRKTDVSVIEVIK